MCSFTSKMSRLPFFWVDLDYICVDLKNVVRVVTENPFTLFFSTGDAELRIKDPDKQFSIVRSANSIHGCLAVINF